MNKDILQGNWKQLKGAVQEQWGKLTDDQFEQIQGDQEKLIGAIQENYGVVREDAEEQVQKWKANMAA